MTDENRNTPGEEEPVDLFDILTDENNCDPVIFTDANGKEYTFEQVAVIPFDVGGETRLYCVLKPMDKIEGVADDEAIVFYLDTDEDGDSILRVEDNETIAREIFDRYYDLLREAGVDVD